MIWYHETSIKSLICNKTQHNENPKPVFQLKIGDALLHIPKKTEQINQNEVHKHIYQSLNFSRKNMHI